MRVLFVTPSETGSGEAITTLSMAESVAHRAGQVSFLASAFTARFLERRFPGKVAVLSGDLPHNREAWGKTLRDFRPDVVVFADYPLLFLSSGAAKLADAGWLRQLDESSFAPVTLDHVGYAQGPMSLFFGPPHLTFHCETFPELPSDIHVLLPCPLQEPAPVPGRRGTPFRHSTDEETTRLTSTERRDIRLQYLDDERDFLVFHSIPTWAWKMAKSLGLPHYDFLPHILGEYLHGLPRPVTVVSVNNGRLLAPVARSGVHIVNLPMVLSDQYDQLLLASDLMITDNAVSVSLGKAVCALVPCAVLRNSHPLVRLLEMAAGSIRRLILDMEAVRPGCIYPYEVFPIWGRDQLDDLGLFRQNSLGEAVATVEVFGGDTSRRQLQGLLADKEMREALRSGQRRYLERVQALPAPYEALRSLTG
jgi:hypothetical protein